MAAGRCLVASATKNEMTLIAVVLNCSPMYADCSKMLDYGFENYHMEKIVTKDTVYGNMPVKKGFAGSLDYISEKTAVIPVKNDDVLSTEININMQYAEAPVKKGDTAGYIDVILNGEKIDRINLVFADETKKNTFLSRFLGILQNNFS